MVSKTKRIIFVSALAIAIVGASVYGATSALAYTTQQNTIVQKIAQKFNLKTEEVQAIFDQERSERQAEMQKRFDEKLTEAVKNGELTENQKKLILEKHAQLKANREAEAASLEGLSPTERRAKMDAKRTELENWAKENGIDLKYFMGGMGKFGGGRGMKHAR